MLDVGCGPGALTSELVSRIDHQQVAAVDPSVTFVDAVRRRYPSIELLREAGMTDIGEAVLSVTVEHHSFEDWWDPFKLGVGPAGSYLSTLASPARRRLMGHCHELIRPAPFAVTAVAWAARGSVPRQWRSVPASDLRTPDPLPHRRLGPAPNDAGEPPMSHAPCRHRSISSAIVT